MQPEDPAASDPVQDYQELPLYNHLAWVRNALAGSASAVEKFVLEMLYGVRTF